MKGPSGLTIGQQVYFGRTAGEKTLGTVLKINGASIKVRQDEARGGKPVGTEWRVHPSLVYPLDGAKVAVPAAPPATFPTRAPARSAGWNVGDRASFTGKDGRAVTGTVTRVNEKTVTIEQCDDGSRGYRVPPAMLRAGGAAKATQTASAAARCDDDAVMRDIHNAYIAMSPENLICDGELTRAQVATRRAAVNRRLADLQAELGRRVSEDEAWAWYMNRPPA